MNLRNAISFAGIAVVLVYVVGSGLWVNTGDSWYNNLNRPSWQPPGYIFGIIWPYNFIVLGIAAFARPTCIHSSCTYLLGIFCTLCCSSSVVGVSVLSPAQPYSCCNRPYGSSCAYYPHEFYPLYDLTAYCTCCGAISSVGGNCCNA